MHNAVAQKFLLALSLLISAAAIIGCGGSPAESSASQGRRTPAVGPQATYAGPYPIRVVCTTGMVADVVRNVGGQRVDVAQLMGEGVDPHLFNASARDVSRLSQADLIFYSGLHLEGKMGEVFEQLGRRRPTLAVSSRLEREHPERLLRIEEGYYDPHIWFDVALWSEAVAAAGEELARFDPRHAEEYRERTQQYRDELADLDAWCGAQIASIPREQRVMVTAHDAFHYFGRKYDIEVRAIQGVSTDTEAGVKQVNELVDFIVRRGVKAVFVETSVSDRRIRALIEGCRERGHDVQIGGSLFSDAMGPLGTPEGTYVGMVRHNVETIAAALK